MLDGGEPMNVFREPPPTGEVELPMERVKFGDKTYLEYSPAEAGIAPPSTTSTACSPPGPGCGKRRANVAKQAVDGRAADELRRTVALACRILAHMGLVRDITGHVSARIPGTDEMVIRCRGDDEFGLAFTRTRQVRRVDFDGHGGGLGKRHVVPLELPIHGELYRARPEVGAVVHAHPAAVLLCGLAGLELRPVFGAYDAYALGVAAAGVPVFPRSLLIDGKEIAGELIEAMAGHDTCLMRGHGITVVGATVEQATIRALKLEVLAEVTWQLATSGREVGELPEDEVAAFLGRSQGGLGDPRRRALALAALRAPRGGRTRVHAAVSAPATVVRLGIAGLGQAGSQLVGPALRHRRFQLTAAAYPDSGLRERFAHDVPAATFESVEELVRRADVDLVYIATPTHLHAAHALAALAAGKHVIVEKPMAVTMEDARAMVDAAEAAGLQLLVGHSQSLEPPIRAMRRLVADGAVGQLRMIHTLCYTDWLYRPRRPDELDTTLGGGVVYRQGAHQVDILRWIAGGMARSVRAVTGHPDPGRPADGSHVMLLTFEGGAAGAAIYSGHDHFQTSELTFGRGEDGRPATSGPGAARRRSAAGDDAQRKREIGFAGQHEAEPQLSFFGLTLVSGELADLRQSPDGIALHGDNGIRTFAVPAQPTGREQLLDEAFAAITTGRPAPHDGRWGLANLEVCVAALESARTGAELALRHQVPTRTRAPRGGRPAARPSRRAP